LAPPLNRGTEPTLLQKNADDGLDAVPTHPKAEEALAWMGFEGQAVLDVLDPAIKDQKARPDSWLMI